MSHVRFKNVFIDNPENHYSINPVVVQFDFSKLPEPLLEDDTDAEIELAMSTWESSPEPREI